MCLLISYCTNRAYLHSAFTLIHFIHLRVLTLHECHISTFMFNMHKDDLTSLSSDGLHAYLKNSGCSPIYYLLPSSCDHIEGIKKYLGQAKLLSPSLNCAYT